MKKVLIVTVIILAISILAGYFHAVKAQDSTKTKSDISFLDKLILKKSELDNQIAQIEKEMKATASGDTTWHTGKRGGVYFINSHGNKVYRRK